MTTNNRENTIHASVNRRITQNKRGRYGSGLKNSLNVAKSARGGATFGSKSKRWTIISADASGSQNYGTNTMDKKGKRRDCQEIENEENNCFINSKY